ncbi:hypothetical protein DPSP01_014139, partial [Paraphaeosphaeria sporulosa]
YWDEPRDAGKCSSSIIFDATTGFGGDGRELDGCLTDGPFANYSNAIGPEFLVTDHSIDRNISDEVSLSSSQEKVDYVTLMTRLRQHGHASKSSRTMETTRGPAAKILLGLSH